MSENLEIEEVRSELKALLHSELRVIAELDYGLTVLDYENPSDLIEAMLAVEFDNMVK